MGATVVRGQRCAEGRVHLQLLQGTDGSGGREDTFVERQSATGWGTSGGPMRDRRSINYYDVLGVDRTSSADDIKAAYRVRVSAAHPDHNRSANAAAVTARLNEAWHVLGDPARRRAYDAEMFPHPAVTSRAAPPQPSTGRRYADTALGILFAISTIVLLVGAWGPLRWLWVLQILVPLVFNAGQRLWQRRADRESGGDDYIVTSRDVTNSRSGCLTVSTGHDAVRTTRSATLPTSNWASVPRPCVPMTMRLMFADLA